MIETRVNELYQQDLILLKDIENRSIQSKLSPFQVLDNEISIFRKDLNYSYYRILLNYSIEKHISLYQAAEKYKLARKAAVFSKIRQFRYVFNLWKISQKRGKELYEDIKSFRIYSHQQLRELEYKARNMNDAYLKAKCYTQLATSYEKIKLKKLQKQSEKISSLGKRQKKRAKAIAFDAICNKYYDLQELCEKRIKGTRHKLMRNVFREWNLLANQHILQRNRLIEFLRERELMLKAKVFNSIVKYYYRLQRTIYNENLSLSLREEELAKLVFLGLRNHLKTCLLFGKILGSIEDNRLEVMCFYAWKSRYHIAKEMAEIGNNKKKRCLSEVFNEMKVLTFKPQYLELELESFRHILALRLEYKVFVEMRKSCVIANKFNILEFRLNYSIYERAFESLRETSKLMEYYRKSNQSWKWRNGVFQSEKGTAGDVMKEVCNRLLRRDEKDLMRLKETTESDQLEYYLTKSGNKIPQFIIEPEEKSTLSKYLQAWKAYVSRARLLNLNLMLFEEKKESELVSKTFQAIKSEIRLIISEIRDIERQYPLIERKAFDGLREKMREMKIYSLAEIQLEQMLMQELFDSWRLLLPFKQFLSSLHRHLLSEDVPSYQLNQYDNLPVEREIELLLGKYQEILPESIEEFAQLLLNDSILRRSAVDYNQLAGNRYERLSSQFAALYNARNTRLQEQAFSSITYWYEQVVKKGQQLQRRAERALMSVSWAILRQHCFQLTRANKACSEKLLAKAFAVLKFLFCQQQLNTIALTQYEEELICKAFWALQAYYLNQQSMELLSEKADAMHKKGLLKTTYDTLREQHDQRGAVRKIIAQGNHSELQSVFAGLQHVYQLLEQNEAAANAFFQKRNLRRALNRWLAQHEASRQEQRICRAVRNCHDNYLLKRAFESIIREHELQNILDSRKNNLLRQIFTRLVYYYKYEATKSKYYYRLKQRVFEQWNGRLVAVQAIMEGESLSEAKFYNTMLLRNAYYNIYGKLVELLTCEQQIFDSMAKYRTEYFFGLCYHEHLFLGERNEHQLNQQRKKYYFSRILRHHANFANSAGALLMLHCRNTQQIYFNNLQLLYRKQRLTRELAVQTYNSKLVQKAFHEYRQAFYKLNFYNYDPRERTKRALQEWKRIARGNSITRHLEVRAERFNRKKVINRIFSDWRACCGYLEDSW